MTTNDVQPWSDEERHTLLTTARNYNQAAIRGDLPAGVWQLQADGWVLIS
jgi:hypothetical protein